MMDKWYIGVVALGYGLLGALGYTSMQGHKKISKLEGKVSNLEGEVSGLVAEKEQRLAEKEEERIKRRAKLAANAMMLRLYMPGIDKPDYVDKYCAEIQRILQNSKPVEEGERIEEELRSLYSRKTL